MTTPPDPKKDETIPFYPDHVRTEFWVALGVLVIVVIIGIIGMIKPLGLGDPADPLLTPHVKPEWYFLALYQILKYVSKTVGFLIPLALVALVVLWPFIDRKPDKSPRLRRIRFIVSVALLVILIALTIWGEVS